MTQFPELAAPAKSWPNEFLLRRPGDPVARNFLPFAGLGREVRRFLAMQVDPVMRDEAPRTLMVQGEPGTGKSEGALVAALETGFCVGVLSAGMFASEVERGATKSLDAVLDEFSRWSAAQSRRVVVIINDIDLSIMARDDKTGITCNTNLLLERFHYLADNRHMYRNGDGSNIGFIVTVNDATVLRESLYRPGRAISFDHTPSEAERIDIAWQLLGPMTAAERALVDKLTRRYCSQPITFWKALSQTIRMPDLPLHAALAPEGMRQPLTPERVLPAAHTLSLAKARNWLASFRRISG